MKRTIGVVGLGIMGGAMAESLLRAGYPVVGYDIRLEARDRLKAAGGTPLASSRAVAAHADVMIVSLAKPEALADAVHQIAEAERDPAKGRLVVIETSTFEIADKLAAAKKLADHGIGMLDCPISGTAIRLEERAWTIFVSGDPDDAHEVAGIFEVFTDNAPYVGGVGDGTKMKYIANHLVAIYNVAVAETMTLARKMDLDPERIMSLFATSPITGTSVFRSRGRMMANRRYQPPTMKVEVWQKDMQVIGDMAKSVQCPVPLFNTCAPIYTAAMAMGLAQHDTASVCEVLGANAGIPPVAP